jgi:hypothetical protein
LSQYVTLIGAEDVRAAAGRMETAASQMQSAASSIEFALDAHQRFLNDWLDRLDGVLADRISDFRVAQS